MRSPLTTLRTFYGPLYIFKGRRIREGTHILHLSDKRARSTLQEPRCAGEIRRRSEGAGLSKPQSPGRLALSHYSASPDVDDAPTVRGLDEEAVSLRKSLTHRIPS